MRVLLVTMEYPPRVWGGAGVYVTNLVRHLEGRVDLAVLTARGETDFGRDLAVPDFPVHRLDLPDRRWPFSWYEFARAARRFTRDHAADFDLVNDQHRCLAGVPPPLVVTVHSLDSDENRVPGRKANPLLRRLARRPGLALLERTERRVLRGADGLLTVSRATARSVGGIAPGRPVGVAGAGVDTALFRPSGVERDIDVLFVGRLIERKGVLELLAALDRLEELRLGVLCGSFAGRFVRREVDRHREQNPGRLEVIEGLPHDGMPALLSRAKVVAVPSRYEPFGLVAAEAMACGAVVVASRTDGLPEVVGKDGILVPPGDPDALRAALRRLLRDDAVRAELSRRGPAAARAFDWGTVADRTLAFWRRIAASRSGGGSRLAGSASGR